MNENKFFNIFFCFPDFCSANKGQPCLQSTFLMAVDLCLRVCDSSEAGIKKRVKEKQGNKSRPASWFWSSAANQEINLSQHYTGCSQFIGNSFQNRKSISAIFVVLLFSIHFSISAKIFENLVKNLKPNFLCHWDLILHYRVLLGINFCRYQRIKALFREICLLSRLNETN